MGGRGLWALGAVLMVGCAKPEPEPSASEDDAPIAPYDPLVYVDPLIATGGLGAQVTGVSPGASSPFGMTLTGPDTRSSAYGAPAFYHYGGYHYDDDLIDGFSHTHSHGMGINDFGAVLLMPRAGWEDRFTTSPGRAAPFDHAEEDAEAGYYRVTLQDDGTEVEIAATPRGAHHRWRFAPGEDPVALVDLGHVLGTVEIAEAQVEIDVAEGRITGFQRLLGGYSERFGGLQTHFVVQLDPAPVASGAWDDPEAPVPGETVAEGQAAGIWAVFPEGTQEVHARVALSYVDLDGAQANLDAELPDLDFEARREEVADAWRQELAGVRVRGGSEADRRVFHTAQYHTRLMPSLMVDVDGRYRGVDGELHTSGEPYYSDFSLWDTFRTLHPWLILTSPDRQRELVRSLVQMIRDVDAVPRWPLAHGTTGGMVGSPADQVFAETWLKGIDGWDADLAFDACYAHATGPVQPVGRGAIEAYRSLGYVPFEASSTPASRTLEYAWSDHALSLWARRTGRTAEAEVLQAQSGSWANTWDPEAGFFVGRYEDGSFAALPNPFAWVPSYVEGNAWHYVWYVPYDIDGMIGVQHGGDRDAFEARLRDYWQEVYAEPDDLLPDDWYWHGNEPVLHYVALGSLAGYPELSAEPARWILENRYDDTPEGLDGNDDGGTLSAWYLWNAMGLYPVAGTDLYVVTSPFFERVEIDRPEGTLVIRAPGVGEDALYVQAATLGGEAVGAVLTHGELVEGGELVLEMGEVVSGWGRR